MTDNEPGAKPEPAEPDDETSARRPGTPRPSTMAVVFLLVGLMFYNAYLDAQPGDYNGMYLTATCAALIAGALGFDLKFWRGEK